MKQIKFTRYGASTLLGNFAPGDRARLDDAAARHLVEEIGVAEYVASPAPVVVEVPSPPAVVDKPKKGRSK